MILKNYKEAMADSQAKKWYGAYKAKYNSQTMWNIFTIIILPYDQKVIERKWVFKFKNNLNYSIDKYKARWVAKSY